MPKQIRNPSSEAAAQTDAGTRISRFWIWGDHTGATSMILREGTPEEQPPPENLMERTARFGEAIVRFVKRVPRGSNYPENNRLVDQLVGAGTSIGANYSEADDAVSRKDFRNKIGTCRKESKETMFFLRMLAASEESLADEARTLWREAKELNLIFGSIWRKTHD
jgi:four helix bundle protein